MWRRLALIPFGLLLAVLLLEGGLQVASLIAQTYVGANQPMGVGSGDLRVLCIGDSNTYGLYLDRDESYPSQLEKLWNATHPSTLEVLNLGMPGTNSSWLVRESERLLDTFRPDLVILMVGNNDFWTRPIPTDGASVDRNGWLRHSKILRAVYMARKGRQADVLEVVNNDNPLNLNVKLLHPLPVDRPRAAGSSSEARYGDEEFVMAVRSAKKAKDAGDDAGLRRNLATLTERVRARDTEILLMSYPARRGFYARASRHLRTVATVLDVPFVDLDALFAPLCPEDDCPEVLFSDGHPTAQGYHMVAEAIIQWLDRSKLLAPR